MKKMQDKKTEWKAAGHGEYSEIPEEKEFFNVTKGSDRCVIHFYRDETFRCKILDKHFNILAKKHLETRFCKINAEKCPFLCERLKVIYGYGACNNKCYYELFKFKSLLQLQYFSC